MIITEHDNDKSETASETVVAWISESWKDSKKMFMSNP